MGQQGLSMLIENTGVLNALCKIVNSFTSDPVLQQDLMQECLIHLWRVENEKPGRTKSWYLQSCRYHVQHWLALGRSVDSPKRSKSDSRLALDEDEVEKF